MFLGCALLVSTGLFAQTNPTPQAIPYSQNFSGLLHTSTTYPAGWQGWKVSGAATNTYQTVAPIGDQALVASSSASTNSGGVHNYNGKIGELASGSTNPAIALALVTTGSSNIKVTYDIMVIRNPYDGGANNRINEATLQYRVGNSGAFTTLTGIEYQSGTTLQTTSGVTTPQNPQTKSITLPSACDNQAIVQLRWISKDVTGGGSRPSFAVDNISVDADNDNDTYVSSLDCNDNDAAIYPGATEVCNFIDDDCDATADNGITYLAVYDDADGDTYGAGLAANYCVFPGAGYSLNNSDCDDLNGAINPGATEVCNAIDDDCDGTPDNGLTFTTYYNDADADGYGSDVTGTASTCDGAPAGYVASNDDCNNFAFGINPGATEFCNGIDDNCIGGIDDGLTFTTYYNDADADGYGSDVTGTASTCDGAPAGYVASNDDCNNFAFGINPGATEFCNGIDDNCIGGIDDGLTFTTYYNDADADGYGSDVTGTTSTCDGAPAGFVASNDDCNNFAFGINPGATEFCNGIDDNCIGGVDDGLTFTDYYNDFDGDGYGAEGDILLDANSVVTTEGSVFVYDDGFTKSEAAQTFTPIVTGEFTEFQFNVNTLAAPGMLINFQLATGDIPGGGTLLFSTGVTVATTGWFTISLPPGITATAGNKYNFLIKPSEVNTNSITLWRSSGGPNPGMHAGGEWLIYDEITDTFSPSGIDDLDFKQFVSTEAGPAISSCNDPGAGYVLLSTDCNDANNAINPAATEVCNAMDEDCDGIADNGLTFTTYYKDNDADTYGDDTYGTATTCDGAPATYVADNTDCEDFNAAINPAAIEVCNFVDDNCSGIADEGLPLSIFYQDADGDSYGNPAATLEACGPYGVMWVSNNEDCDDDNNAVNPDATEICDGLDNNCDGNIDDGLVVATITPSGVVMTCKGVPQTFTANTGVGYTYQWFKNGNIIVGATSSTYSSNKPANYQVQVNTPEGCFALSEPTGLGVSPNPNANISAPSGLNMCLATVKLKASFGATYSYQWYLGAAPISGATNFTYFPVATGNYSCVITNEFNCSRTTATVTVINVCKEGLTAEAVESNTSLAVYPNPADNLFNVEMELDELNTDATVTVFNILGEVVYAENVTLFNGTLNTTVDASSFTSGAYIVTVNVSGKMYSTNLMITE